LVDGYLTKAWNQQQLINLAALVHDIIISTGIIAFKSFGWGFSNPALKLF
jgi:hypothetical protein